mmetsp:Transcript_6247/g.12442  ORF Transcript_6247/g.12442 Transcript_6247/m.12442 type:complete len:271 (-) Transcript_6247:305-1117(-)
MAHHTIRYDTVPRGRRGGAMQCAAMHAAPRARCIVRARAKFMYRWLSACINVELRSSSSRCACQLKISIPCTFHSRAVSALTGGSSCCCCSRELADPATSPLLAVLLPAVGAPPPSRCPVDTGCSTSPFALCRTFSSPPTAPFLSVRSNDFSRVFVSFRSCRRASSAARRRALFRTRRRDISPRIQSKKSILTMWLMAMSAAGASLLNSVESSMNVAGFVPGVTFTGLRAMLCATDSASRGTDRSCSSKLRRCDSRENAVNVYVSLTPDL